MKKTMQVMKTASHIIQGRRVTLVARTEKLLHHLEEEKFLAKWDQEGCRLGLKVNSDEH
jgi:hypothetical protein